MTVIFYSLGRDFLCFFGNSILSLYQENKTRGHYIQAKQLYYLNKDNRGFETRRYFDRHEVRPLCPLHLPGLRFDHRSHLNVLNLGILSNDSVSTLLRNVLLSFAQFERDMIVQRTQKGKAIARQHPDYREGRPKKFKPAQVDHALELLKAHSYKQVSAMTGISESTLLRRKRSKEQNK